MLDNAFGIFNNVPPRVQWTEIDLPFQGDDDIFRLSNFNEVVARSLVPQRRIKIKDAFYLLFAPRETAEKDLMGLRNGHLTAFDMQMLIHFTSSPHLAPDLKSNKT